MQLEICRSLIGLRTVSVRVIDSGASLNHR